MRIKTTILFFFILTKSFGQSAFDPLDLPEWGGARDFTTNAQVIAAFGSLTITGYKFTGPAPSTNGNTIRFIGCAGPIVITKNYFTITGGGSDDANRAIYISGGSGHIIDTNFFWNVRGGPLVSSTTGNVKIRANRFLNITGPHPAGQMIAVTFASGAGNVVSDNFGENWYGESYAEDMTSLNGSDGTSGSPFLCEDNVWKGDGPSYSGGGIVAGEGAGGSYVIIQRNHLLEPGNYGVALVETADHSSLLTNYIYQPMKPWTNNGVLCYDSPTNANIQGNKAYVIFGHNPGCPTCTPGASNPQYYNDYTVVSGGAVNNPTLYGTTQGQAATALAAFMVDTDFPAEGTMFSPWITLDEYYQLRASKLSMQHIIDEALAQDGVARRRIERPTANAPVYQSISTSTTTLIGTGTPLPAGENVIAAYLWEFVSGPTTPTIVSATSATTNITGMSASGTYRFRFRVSQENYLNLYPTEDVFTWHWGWTEVTVNSSAQTKYYISNSGSDAAAGTLAAPWLTIAKVNSSTFNPGDSIFFNKDDVWKEQLTIPSSGTAGNHIVFTAYGSGAKPIINGADIKTAWVDGYNNINSNIWGTASTNATTTRAMVVINGTIYAEVSAITGLTTPNTYFIKTASTPDSLYVYNTTDPDALTAEVSKRDYCIMAVGTKHHITIDGIESRYAGRAGFYFEGPGTAHDGATNIYRSFAYANREHGFIHIDKYNNFTVEDCKATYNGNGFYSWQADGGTFRRDTTSNQIHYEAISSFTDGGAIQSFQGDNWLVEYCYSDSDYDAIHIAFSGASADGIIRYNKVFNSRAGSPNTQGIGTGGPAAGDTVQIYYNLMVNCASAGFETYGTNSGKVFIYNNTIYNNTATATLGSVYLGTNGTNFILKNNLIVRDYVVNKSTFVNVGATMSTNDYNNYYILNNVSGTLRNSHNGSVYTTMAAWRTATSQDANSITVDPLLVNVASDWSLQSGSPCANAGVSLGLTQDINGNPIVGNPDIGAYELQTEIRYRGRIFLN